MLIYTYNEKKNTSGGLNLALFIIRILFFKKNGFFNFSPHVVKLVLKGYKIP